jgi:site-specific recombinase XerD
MATIKLILDKRVPKKNGTFPISLYIYDRYKTTLINLGASLTEKDYKDIFEKTPTGKRLEYRRSCEELLNRAIDLYRSMKPFDLKEFKARIFQAPQSQDKKKDELLVEVAFDGYIRSNAERLKLKTISGYKTTKNCILRFKPNARIEDINPAFLSSFESWYTSLHSTTKLNASVNIHMRQLRAVINWLKSEEKLPQDYKYPFGNNKYSIKNIVKPKLTLTQDEIKRLISLNQFKSKKEERARDLWLMQFYCNGVNLNDLIRLKWTDKNGDCFVIQREKTKNTVKNNPVLIKIPILKTLQELLNKIGNRNSPYVLGFLEEGMTEAQILERKRKLSKFMNPHLKEIGKRLNLSIELLSETSRDAYATTLKRNGRTIEQIAEMLGQSSTASTRHYLAKFENDQLHNINSVLES